ncbi:GNAT family N-acetyltransferase [Candidatus Binatia bacterium]|jgi:RimJ/RimL family protein N-acetyltransferase|nr:GNAT family N-acetyltransferase [Candidatus Binatia bacterium]
MSIPPDRITTARLVLRRPQPSDADAMYAFGRDPEVARFMDWTRHTSPRDAVAFIESAHARWQAAEEYAWAITVQPDDAAIGSVACRVRGHAVDLGYVLARPCWGHGYATEAAKAVFEWAVSVAAVCRIWATCDAENAASAHVLEKIGMSREGILRRWSIRPNLAPGVARDALVYSWVRTN